MRLNTVRAEHTERVATFRQILGCIVNERLQLELALNRRLSRLSHICWQDLCNRKEHISIGSASDCRICNWPFTSWLTVARIFPKCGAKLLRRAIEDWPFQLRTEVKSYNGKPELSVIIPVGGKDRVSQFEIVMQSWFAQSFHEIELVVVEHSQAPFYREKCPASVQYAHLPLEPGRMFNKSKAMNYGVKIACAKYVVLHDADVVVPYGYAENIVALLDRGWESLKPARFVFFLDRLTSEKMEAGVFVMPKVIQNIQQNNPGISTVATQEAYWAIGGHDERFEGWGLEDNEFLERMQTRRYFEGGWIPMIHLWHPTSTSERIADRINTFKLRQLQKPTALRIEELNSITKAKIPRS